MRKYPFLHQDVFYLLNLLSQVMIGGVAHKYSYSADGRKFCVEKETTSRDYVGILIYENGSLKRVLIDGYIESGIIIIIT